MYTGLHVNLPLFLSDFNETWNMSTDFRKVLRYQILLKFVPLDSSRSMLKDGRTGRDEDNFATRIKVALKLIRVMGHIS
jgi:hypothetical protein